MPKPSELRAALVHAQGALSEANEALRTQNLAYDKERERAEELRARAEELHARAEEEKARRVAAEERIVELELEVSASLVDARRAEASAADRVMALEARVESLLRQVQALELGEATGDGVLPLDKRMSLAALRGDKNGTVAISLLPEKTLTDKIKEIVQSTTKELNRVFPEGWADRFADTDGEVLHKAVSTLSSQLCISAEGAGSLLENGDFNEYSQSLQQILEKRLAGHLCRADIKVINQVMNTLIPISIQESVKDETGGRANSGEAMLVLWHRAFGNTTAAFQGIFSTLSELIDAGEIDKRMHDNPEDVCQKVDDLVKRLFRMAGNGQGAMQCAMYKMALPRIKYSATFAALSEHDAAKPSVLRAKLRGAWREHNEAHEQRKRATEQRKTAQAAARASAEQKKRKAEARVAATSAQPKQTPEKAPKRQRPQKNECRTCANTPGYDGHNAWKCPKKVCYHCRETGHVAALCPKKGTASADGNGEGAGHDRPVASF